VAHGTGNAELIALIRRSTAKRLVAEYGLAPALAEHVAALVLAGLPEAPAVREVQGLAETAGPAAIAGRVRELLDARKAAQAAEATR
jgi:3-oxoacyl-ACP reductase-like protein